MIESLESVDLSEQTLEMMSNSSEWLSIILSLTDVIKCSFLAIPIQAKKSAVNHRKQKWKRSRM